MQDALQAQRATRWFFLICGIGLSSWAPMVPFVKERLGLNDASLGLVLLLLGAGAITMMPVSGILVHRLGSRIIMIAASLMMGALLPLLLVVNTLAGLCVILFLFGISVGAVDVAMNTQAVQVQNLRGKAIMSSLHGLYSVGGLVGSIGFGLLMKAGLQPFIAAVIIAAVICFIALGQYKFLLPADKEKKAVQQFSATGSEIVTRRTWLKASIIFLGTMSFIVFLAEGALLDWSAVFLRENLEVEEALTGIGYAAFSIAMAVMRLTGDRIVGRLSEKSVVFWGALIAAAGFFIAVSFPWLITALLGFILVGIGAANIVPVFFSAGGRLKDVSPAVAIPVITTMGYAGQLAGPAMLGFIAYKFTLPAALSFNAFLLLLVAIAYKYKSHATVL